MVVSQTTGSVEYMRLVRQRGNQIGHADITDVGNAEESESATSDHEMEVEPAASSSMMTPAAPQTIEEMEELLKAEHEICLECVNFWDANAIQNLILEFLQVVRNGITEILSCFPDAKPVCSKSLQSLVQLLCEEAERTQHSATIESPACTHHKCMQWFFLKVF